MILIRADGSGKTGSGHLMRCMTIAEQLKKREEVCFITASEESIGLIQSRGFQAELLEDINGEMDRELPQIELLVQKKGARILLVDSYLVSESYLAGLRAFIKTIYLDDFGGVDYPVDMVINYNVFADRQEYRERYADRNTEYLVGADYIPIRQEFLQAEYHVRRELKKVLLLTGGGDYYHLADKFVNCFGNKEELKEIEFHLILGYYNHDKEQLKAKAEKYGNFRLYENVSDIWNLMRDCDLAITAGGTTVYELCAVGVPFIGYSFADNQQPVMKYLKKHNLAVYCGDYRTEQDALFESFTEQLSYYRDAAVRETFSRKEKTLVDGKGAIRIADSIIQC